MPTRRTIIRWAVFSLAAMVTRAWAGVKRRLLARDTPRNVLAKLNPIQVDAHRLAVTPLSDFDTMGITDHQTDLVAWRLRVAGAVQTPLSLTYAEITAMPAMERKVLMVCPGVFANTGIWKGVPIGPILDAAGADPKATHLIVSSAPSADRQRRRFAIADIHRTAVFLAHTVNGVPLPVRHGYPLRIVAEDDYGDAWLKYVDHMEVIGPPADRQSRK